MGLLKKPTLNVGTIAGGLNINSVSDRAVIGVDIRTVPSLPNDAVYEKMKSYLGEDVKIIIFQRSFLITASGGSQASPVPGRIRPNPLGAGNPWHYCSISKPVLRVQRALLIRAL